MLPTRSTWVSTVLFIAYEIVLLVGIARGLALPPIPTNDTLSDTQEAAIWLVVTLVLLCMSSLLYAYLYYEHYTSKGQTRSTEMGLAKLDRNAVTFVNYTLFLSAYAVFFAILAVCNVIPIGWLRTTIAAQGGLLPTIWLASVIPYTTLQEETPSAKNK